MCMITGKNLSMGAFAIRLLWGAIIWLLLLQSMAQSARIVGISLCEKVREPGTIPVNSTEKFNTATPKIHAVVVASNVEPGTRFRGVWVSVDAIQTPNFEIDRATVPVYNTEARLHFSIPKPYSGWPTGNYKLDLYIDDAFFTSSPFSIAAVAANSFQKSAPAAQAPQRKKPKDAGATSGLIGKWISYTEAGALVLVFESSDRLVFDGEAAAYTLTPGVLRVQEEYGAVDYPYSLQGDQLVILFPEGYRLKFNRAPASGTAPSAQSSPQNPQRKGGQPAGQAGQEYLLQGRLCRWSGSSSSYAGTSYSSTGWAVFDGRGNFSYGSEASFSGDAGMYHSGNQNPGNRGTYRVQGNQIHLIFSDGSKSVATVHMQQNNGSITEVMFDGNLYATGLCE